MFVLSFLLKNYLKNKGGGFAETTQQLRALGTLQEDLGSIFSTHMELTTQENPTLSSGLHREQASMLNININAGKTLIIHT